MINVLKNKKIGLFVLFLLLIIVVLYFVLKVINVSNSVYKNDYYKVSYDETWKVVLKKDNLKLKHRKSKSSLSISYKILSDDLIDVSLKDMINDIVYSIEKQNKNYNLLTKDNVYDKYEGYKLLYEDKNEQCLVTIYKKDNVLVFITYNANSKYFDIVLDSVDSIINSLEIYSGVK